MFELLREDRLRLRQSLFWVVLLSFGPLLYWHISQLLSKPHYQFIYLLPVVIWILASASAADESDRAAEASLAESVPAFIGLGLSLLGLVAGCWIWSPWVAAVAFQIAWLSALTVTTGWQESRRWLPAWVFSWVLIPLPFGMDEDLIVYLRGITTRLASSVLDQIGVLHNTYANVIELPGKPLFVADACSGIHSLYVLTAAALFVSVWNRRGVIHTIGVLFSTFALVLVENISRIVCVAGAFERRLDLSSGWRHELLGVVLFCCSLLLILSVDQLLAFVLPGKAPGPLEVLRYVFGRRGRSSTDSTTQSGSGTAASRIQTVSLALTLLFPVAGVAQLFRMPASVPTIGTLTAGEPDLPQFGPDQLPAQLEGFERTGYEVVQRVPGDPLGQASQQWYFSRGSLHAMVSLDYPYSGVHDLCVCYSQIGWKVLKSDVFASEELDDLRDMMTGPVAVGWLDRDLYGRALLAFQLWDMSGRELAVVKDQARGDVRARIENRFSNETVSGDPVSLDSPEPPYFQVQMLARSGREISQTERADLLRLFAAARSVLKPVTMDSSRSERGGDE